MNFSEHVISETCIEYRFGEAIDIATNDKVLRAYHVLKQSFDTRSYKIRDILPTYTTLAIHFEPDSPLFDDTAPLRDAVKRASEYSASVEGKHILIDVRYDGMDTEEVCRQNGLTLEELIALHTGRSYRIAMLGFRPYFPYLLGLDERLDLPRRKSPRTHVAKGSVAIAAGQTGIYPEASPGGWHIIGHTDFDAYKTLRPGDTITFRSIPC